MKSLRLTLSALLLACLTSMVTTACGGDDDEPNTPPFANEAMKYNAASNAQGIQSFEITSDGDYIIITSDNQAIKPSEPDGSGANSPSIKFGKLTINADGTMTLSGYGTATLSGSTLTLKPTNGQKITLNVTKASLFNATPSTMALCRAWTTDRAGFTITMGNTTTFDQLQTLSQLQTTAGNYLKALASVTGGTAPTSTEIQNFTNSLRRDMPMHVVFTRAGTLLYQMSNNTYSLKAWRWRDTGNSIIETGNVASGSTTVNYTERIIVAVNDSELLLSTVDDKNPGGTPQILSTTTTGFSAN